MTSWLPNPFRVVILGGGISGFSAAHTILKHAKVPCQITVLEKQHRAGGWLQSSRYDDGIVIEHGPRSARSTGDVALQALAMISELNVDDKVIGIPQSNDAAKRRFVYANGKMNTLPSTFASILRKKEPFSKSLLSVLMKEAFVKKSTSNEDESVYSFFQRRFGKEIADYMSDPLCRGIFGGDARELSLKSCFPILHEYEENHGSVVRGMMFSKKGNQDLGNSTLVQKAKSEKWVSWSMENGLQTLPDIWSDNLKSKGVNVLLDRGCTEIDISTYNKIKCHTHEGIFEADRLISSLPGSALSPLLKNYDSNLSDLVGSIKYANMAVISLEYENSKIPHSGFGFLAPSSEPIDILGMTFDSLLFPQFTKNSSVVTVMAGGAWFHSLFGMPENADVSKIKELAIQSVRDILHIKEDPKRVVCKIQRDCIPQYTLGHQARAKAIQNYIKTNDIPLTIVGNLYGGVGVNDCIINSRNETLKWMASNHIY